jgi:rhodanese-related sulfurtransferase
MGAGFLVLTVHFIGGIVGGCMLCNLLRSADTGPFGNALLGAVGGVCGAGVVFALSPAFGTLPGALLLGDAGVTAELLGADKSRALVFYCSSEKCGAAPGAAKEAMELGYTEVRVMKAGIKGWVGAGFEVSK